MPRVLMADNAVLFRLLEGSFLRRSGWEIVCAPDGREVVEKARALRPDLVLLDAAARDFDAPSCLEALRSEARMRPIPIVVLADPSGRRTCETAGAVATLSHPVDPAVLEAALSSLAQVSSRRAPRRPARLPVRVETEEGILRGRLKDISRTGVFLTLPRPIPIEATMAMKLILPEPGDPRHVRARGVVVRQVAESVGSHLIGGVGVNFTDVDGASESLIDRFVSCAATAAADRSGEVMA